MKLFSQQCLIGIIDVLSNKNKHINRIATIIIILSGILFRISAKYHIITGPAIHRDQTAHYRAGQLTALSIFFLSVMMFLLLVHSVKKGSAPFKTMHLCLPGILVLSAVKGMAVTFLFALGKEMIDFSGIGTPDIMDFKYTITGCLSAVIPVAMALAILQMATGILFSVVPVIFFRSAPLANLKKTNGRRDIPNQSPWIDKTTNMADRTYFDTFLKKAWRCAKRDNQSIGMIIIHVDLFEEFRNRYGEKKSDMCIQSISSSIKKFSMRGRDLISRVDKNKFAVILTGVEETDLFHIAHKMHRNINNLKIRSTLSSNGEFITCSIGASIIKPDSQSPPSILVESADSALTSATLNGGNTLRFAQIL